MKLTTLARHDAGWFAPALQAMASENGYANVFNPSIARLGDTWHLAFRAQARAGEKPFRAFYAFGGAGHLSPPVDISQLLADFGLPQVADPKLVALAGKMYLTFNTGHSVHSPNSLYLLQVWPEIGTPQKCELNERQMVEKNWAFYIGPDQSLAALYSLEPLMRLQHVGGMLDSGEALRFERTVPSSSGEISQGLSIGSQLAFVSEKEAYMVVHEKPRFRSKRGYLGKLVRLSFDASGGISATVGSRRLIHSFWKLLLLGHRHNPNLLWAVYFAGIAMEGEDLLLSYGINDLEFGFARLPLGSVWH